MGIFSPLYNFLYSTILYIPDKSVQFRPDETERLPALPLGIWRHYTKRDGLGAFNTFDDPRFTRDKKNNSSCRINYAVWRSCLANHSETEDPRDPSAAICKKYHMYLMSTCTPNLFQKFQKDYQNDVWLGIIGLNARDRLKGQNPSWVYSTNGGEILAVINKNKNDPRELRVGDHLIPGDLSWDGKPSDPRGGHH